MEIFNIGILELLFILVLMLILLGPEGMAKTARGLARWVRRFTHSPLWNDMVKAQRDIQELPTKLVRDAGIEEFQQEIQKINQNVKEDLNTIRKPVPMDLPAPVVKQVEPPQEENQLLRSQETGSAEMDKP